MKKTVTTAEILNLIKQGLRQKDVAKLLGITKEIVANANRGARPDRPPPPPKTKCIKCGANKGVNRWYCKKCLERLDTNNY